MNAKHVKQLRKTATFESNAGEPKSQLVMFKQQCTPRMGPDGKTHTPTAFCAVNNPFTFRGRYRTLKSGRSIDVKRIEAAAVMLEQYSKPQPKQNWLQKMAQRFNRVFRHQAR